MPPLRVVKKIIEERKENIEPFTSITPAKDNEPEVLNITKESGVKVMLYHYTVYTYTYAKRLSFIPDNYVQYCLFH